MRGMLAVLALMTFWSAPGSAAEAEWCPVPTAQAAEAAGPLAQRLAPELGRMPAPIAHLHTEHTLPNQGIRDASVAAERDLPVMRDAALVWHAWQGRPEAEPYFAQANRMLVAWAATYQPDFNPIDETALGALPQTYALIQAHMAVSDRTRVALFLDRWAQGYVDRMDEARFSAKPAPRWSNNWQSHRVNLVTLIAAATGRPRLVQHAERLFWLQIGRNLRPDGATLDYTQRDALHYVVYDLEPLLQAALVARARGEDWFHPSNAQGTQTGGSLARAVAWLRPYADGSKTHAEFVHSTVPFDAERARAGVAGFSGNFDPHRAARVFWMASVFDPSYAALARTLAPQPLDSLTLCGQ